MKHTLVILDYFAPHIGGVETLFGDVTRFCANEHMKITILTSRHSPDLSRVQKRGECTIHRVGTSRMTSWLAMILRAIQNPIIMKSVTQIHSSTFTSALAAWVIGFWYRIRVSVTIHELYGKLWYHLKGRYGWFYVLYEWLVCHLPRYRITTVSYASKRMILRQYPHLPPNHIQMIPNQIDTTRWSPDMIDPMSQEELRQRYQISSTVPIFLFVGRLGLEKGLPYILEALSYIDQQLFQLIIIAPRTISLYPSRIQSQIASIERQIKDNYLTSSIIWIDPVEHDEDLRLRMSLSNVGLIPSMSEGYCYMAVQMQSMGLDMIVSDLEVLHEVLSDSTPLFVPYGKVSDWKQALQNTVDDYVSQNQKSQSRPVSRLAIDYRQYYDLWSQE